MSWVNVNKELGLKYQHKVFFLNSANRNYLVDKLFNLGFKVYVLNGKNIDSESSFFEEIYNVLGFPDYCGKNWDAFYDCLGDFDGDGSAAIAIVWDNATSTINKSLYAFIRCLTELVALPEAYRRELTPEGINQIEVFFIGEGKEFLSLHDRTMGEP